MFLNIFNFILSHLNFCDTTPYKGMLVIGGVVSGYASALIGVEACYVLDSATYFISALIMSQVHGEYIANDEDTSTEKDWKISTAAAAAANNTKGTILENMVLAPLRSFYQMNKDLAFFLFSCGFGPLIFIKASGTFIFGAADVLNVSFTHVEGDEAESSRRLGILYRLDRIFISFFCFAVISIF